MRIILKNIIFISFLIITISCKHEKKKEENTTYIPEVKTELTEVKPIKINTELQIKEIALNFTEKIKKGESLISLMNKNWTLIYHEDNRCTGATDGEKMNLSNTQIDEKIMINVKNNSEYAWACEKKEPYNYNFEFDLKKQIENWDRFELQNDDYSDSPNKEKNVFYILGAGDSDLIKIYIGANKLISKLKYNSEDPG